MITRILVSIVLFWFLEILVIAGIIAVWKKNERIAFVPGLDIAVSALTWIPWVLAGWLSGWAGLIGCVIGQFAAMQTFCFWHWKQSGHQGPSIGTTLNRIVGPKANNFALIATLPALPAFLLIRFSQLTTYPILVKAIKLPPYNQSEWVSVSRQKFHGLVGHDLVWCLYCDWMTGLYALGGEMLRNLESFWCPIKFYPGKKCENCKLDFPDIPSWVPPEGTMKDVEDKLVEKYEGKTWNSWWGHPDRKADDSKPPTEPPKAG
ncbi:hypothetical protein BH09VER1_BH09VER1_09580 [soil metagenome]